MLKSSPLIMNLDSVGYVYWCIDTCIHASIKYNISYTLNILYVREVSKFLLTSDLGLEGAPYDVVRSSIFDGDEIVAGGHGGVRDPVALGALHTVHLHLRGSVDGHRQGPGARVAGVHHKLTRRAWDKREEAGKGERKRRRWIENKAREK